VRDDLPIGTVTFLFTDVEGSTKLLHELGAEGYAAALAEHRRVIRETCVEHDGVEVDTQGDAFFFAFPTAPGAIAAAEAMTEALAPGPIQVRIGLHTGTPLLTEEGYVGDALHFAARVASSGHGGQVIVSAATAQLVELELIDLGEHRLKDIPEAVAIYQLGDGSFPPLKTISNTNLPRPASSFVGRDDELLDVLSRFEDGARLVTLTGPGGTGKTRLAIEAASELVANFKAGVFWVGLASLREPALVTETITQTLGAKDGLASHIGERELLFLLDNLEQVIEAAPDLSKLLVACPNLALLVTSRELLRIQGEVEYAVPPLAESEAVELFCARSQLEPSDPIAELCRRLDDMPLAVELAAARTKALSPGQILERLSQRLDLLKGGRDSDPRQQTLRATIEWSYELLSAEERQLFARLSVFAGGCTLEAAEEVADADLDTLQSLVEKSLLRFTEGRYWMLETIREYASLVLASSGKHEDAMGRLVDFVLELASQVESAFSAGLPDESFATEQDNFRAALAWTQQERLPAQHDLIGRSWPFWWYRGHPTDGLRWVGSALEQSRGERTPQRVRVLTAGAMFAYRASDLVLHESYARESTEIARELADAETLIWPLILSGIWATEVHDYRASTGLYEEATELAQATGKRRFVGIVMNNLGAAAEDEGDLDLAVTRFRGALAVSRELGATEEAAVEAVNLSRCLACIAHDDEALEALKEGLAWARGADSLTALKDGFVVAGALAHRRGRAGNAARLVGAAEQLGTSVGATMPGAETAFLEATMRELIRDLGEERYAKALGEGKAMSLDEAVEYAVRSLN
jgi:predicted ATPase